MSASSKKKLRKEQEAAKLTEQQLSAQKEAKKLNLYTTIFVIVLAALLVVALTVGIGQTIVSSGVRERGTVALMVGDHELSNTELNYFYMNAINQVNSQYGGYVFLLGLDPTKPLDEQIVDSETGKTWADDFLDTAKENAAAVYAMTDAAAAEGFTLTEEQNAALEQDFENLEAIAKLYQHPNAESYLKAVYGRGASKESYLEYCRLNALASAYYNAHAKSLTYTEEDFRAVDAENFEVYSSYTFNTYYVSVNKFLEGGTTDEEGNVTFTDEEKAAAVEAAEAAAKTLAAGEYTTVKDFDAAVAALDINKSSENVTSTESKDTLHSKVNALYVDWIADESRKEGDMNVFTSTTASTDEDGNETETVDGYYVVYFVGSDDNTSPLANVRHILVKFQGGTKDPGTGATTYSDEEKAAAKTAAEEILKQWQEGEATEDSFAALANERSDDGDGTTGGLYENVYPGRMTKNFNDWCFETGRSSGDTGIVETEFGYHVMFYSGDSEMTFRDLMIDDKLRSEDMKAWNDEIVGSVEVTEGDLQYIRKDLVLNAR